MIKYNSRRAKAEREVIGLVTESRLINLYRVVYARPRLVKTIKTVGAVSVSFVAFSFVYAFFVLLLFGEYMSALELALFTAVPFFAVSMLRSFINCKRPYEAFDIPELSELGKEKKAGYSFPSRHVFSAFLIGTLWFLYSPWVAACVLFMGVLIALGRVLLGIHFPKDVLAGAVIGTLSGLIGILIW